MGLHQFRRLDRRHPPLPGLGLAERQIQPRQTAGRGLLYLGLHHLVERPGPKIPHPRRFSDFLITRSSTGIDDSSYPGMYSLVSDLFAPKIRGKVYGILQLTQPIGYLIGMVIALMFTSALGGWQNVFFLTGTLGIILAVVIFFFVKDVPRGSGEDELQGVEVKQQKFNWKALSEIFKKKSLWMVYAQGFHRRLPLAGHHLLHFQLPPGRNAATPTPPP